VDWNWLADGSGIIASGERDVYLVTQDHSKGEATGVRLTRYRPWVSAPRTEVAAEAARNVIIIPLGRGPGRPAMEPELAALMESAKVYAGRFEAGESLKGYPAWQHVQPKARRHFHAPFETERECFELHDLPAGDAMADLRAADGHLPDYNRAEADRRLREGKCPECGGTGLVEAGRCTCGAGGYPWPGHEPLCGTGPCPAGCEFVPPTTVADPNAPS
jgi:hypothetical protein